MSDTSNPFAQGYFFAGSDPANLKMREKIALAQMMQKKKVPTNLGEGIYSAADSIAEAISARSLMAADKDAQLAASKLGAPADPASVTPLASEGSSPPIQTAGGQDPTSQVPIQPSVQEGGPPTPPGPMFRPNLRTTTVMPPAAPAVPAPPDVTGATRLSTPEQLADFRGQNPLPRGLPPMPQAGPMPPPGAPPPGEPPPVAPPPARPSVADFGQKPVLAPTPPPSPGAPPPAMAQGPDPASSEDPRRAIGLALLKQQMGGQGGPSRSVPAPAPAPPPAVPDQGIKPAPPMQMVPGQPAPIQGYVPPEMANPTGAKIIQPSRRELELTAVLNANQGNPYAAQSPAANELQRLVKDRELRQTEQNELFKADVARATKREEMRQQALIDQPERVLRVKEQERKLAKPDLEDISDKFERDPVTGKWRQPQMETPQDPNAMPQVKMSKEQADNLTFYGWAGNAQKNMQGKDQLLAHGLQQEILGKVPVFGNQLQDAEYRRARQAANSFVLAFMRDTSGAAYGAKEMYDHASAFLPKQGDDPQTLADKTAARERFIQGKYAGLGQGGQRVAQWQDAQDAAKEQTAAAKTLSEVGRPGARIGETVTSKKTGKQRVWDGKQWHDL